MFVEPIRPQPGQDESAQGFAEIVARHPDPAFAP
jgi:hypothetical protein